MPRDRNGDFEPIIVKKKQSRIAGLDQKIISLYAKGMSLSDIKTQIQELYDTDISESLISKITDGVAEEVKAWQSRALEGVQLKVGAKNKRVFPSDESVFKTL